MAPPDADGHEEIDLGSIANLTIKDGQLYWKKEKLKTETRQRLVLSLPQKIAAVVVSTAVSIAALLTPVSQYVADMDKICPNTSYSAPYCEAWKTRHDAEDQKAKKQPEKPNAANTDMKPTSEALPAPPQPVKTPASPVAQPKNPAPLKPSASVPPAP